MPFKMDFQVITANINHTFNLCGLVDMIKTIGPELVFVQEAGHSSDELTSLVSHLNYSGFTSLDGDQPGVGVIYKNSLEILEIHAWQPGRILYVKLSDVSFVNVYAPSGQTKKHERNIFYSETLLRNLSVKSCLPILLGDFNCILKRDDTTANFGSKFCRPLHDLVNVMNYTDAWTHLHPGVVEFTFFRRGVAPSRLDRIYVPGHLVSEIQSIRHQATTSDHRAVIMGLNLDTVNYIPERHSAYWKLNVSILSHADFMPNFTRLWTNLLSKEANFDTTDIWWEECCKPAFKHFCMKFSTVLARGRRGMKTFLFEALNQATMEQDFTEMAEIKARLKKIINEESMGFVIRSKEKERDLEEQGSIYHWAKEKKMGEKTTLSKLKIGDRTVEDEREIEEHVVSFFSALFNGHHRSNPEGGAPVNTGQPFQPDLSLLPEFLQNLGSIDNETATAMEQPLTLDEFNLAIKTCGAHRSPGLDGISYEFYAKTKDLIGPKLVEVFNNQLRKCSLLPSYRQGVTKLLPKVTTVPASHELRPITLLACDYKIMTKILCMRLAPVLEDVLTSNQLCSRPDSNILFGATDFLSTIDFINTRNLDGYIVGFDMFKAFDKANITVIKKVMEKMNFSPVFINWIDALHRDIDTRFILKSGMTQPVQCNVSVRQGDPFAMFLFLINVEPLLVKMKFSLDGIRIGRAMQGNEGYVDDISHASTQLNDLLIIDGHFARFEKLTGAVINKSKCQIMGIGGWRGRENWPLTWLQPVDEIKIFGIKFHPTVQETIRFSWSECESKFLKCLMSWKGKPIHNLSQRAFVVKTFATSKLWYLCQVLPMPKTTIKYFERQIGTFLWHGKLERLALQELYLEMKQGGLALPNILAKADSLFLMHLVRILKVDCCTRDHLLYWIGLSLRDHFPALVPALRSEVMTPYFKHCLSLLTDSSLSERVEPGTLNTFKTRTIYADFNSTPPPPKVEDKYDLDWETVWQRLNHGVVSSDARDVMFLVIHDIYPTRQRLFRMGLHPTGTCEVCRGVQDVTHLFTGCGHVRDLWLYVKSKLVRNQVISNLSVNDFELLTLSFNIKKKKTSAYCFIICNFVLYVHSSFKKEFCPKINDFRQFLMQNCPLSLDIFI